MACGICTELLNHLQGLQDRESPDIWGKVFPLKCESDTSAACWQSSFELMLSSDGVESFNLSMTFEVIDDSPGQHVTINTSIAIWKLTFKAGITTEYMPSTSTHSLECQNLTKQWLRQCTESHDRCNARAPGSWAPTRLLDVGTAKDDPIILVNGSTCLVDSQPYATLSHFWGRNQIINARMDNIQEFHQGIQFATLPKTWRDAIYVARSIGIRYLWIDALCIIQDSAKDWQRESSMMSMLYRYGFINIAATGAASGNEGCFWDRDPRAVLSTETTLEWIYPNERQTARYRVVPEARIWAQKLMDEPLNQRGWVF
ncbi:HET-domain-containing protein [Ophiobolus disseminans]|uniref:HET-domain-containing protein n=1 Tax=Ophiobolus disseminans TaxID=1469910 RepID=A0A6A6ZUF1_9PLEO|nr:HET-domain-containing protein [Ophiobolus disseminans]